MPKIAVLGAGPSGLAAIKSCKEEGLEVVCFEKNGSFGGMWRYDEDTTVGSVSKTTISLFSKEMSAFSDFPPPRDFTNYLPHKLKMDYLELYAEKFDLLPHIKFNHEMLEVVQAHDFDSSGQWILKLRNLPEENVTENTFDGVFVCTGRRNFPHVPYFADQEIFRGTILHSKFLKSPQEYNNLNVLVIGFGNSAVDAAADICPGAKQVYLSTRSGRWVVPKLGARGLPTDTQFLKRNIRFFQNIAFEKVNDYLENSINSIFNHEEYKIKPDHHVLNHIPTVSDDLPDKILTARIIIKNEISRMTENGVIFKNEDTETKVDAVIVATGYEVKFPFLEDRLWTTYKTNTNLYKFVFPLGLKHNTLAIIGHVQPLGPSVPIAESQCRWAALVFKKTLNLPSQELMKEDVDIKIAQLTKRFYKSSKQCPEVDYIDYMDELADQYGAKPNVMGLMAKDPTLFWVCCFGPCLPYQYRLQGPHSCDKTRDTLLNAQERITFPLNRKPPKQQKKKTATKPLVQSNSIIVIVLSIMCLIVLI